MPRKRLGSRAPVLLASATASICLALAQSQQPATTEGLDRAVAMVAAGQFAQARDLLRPLAAKEAQNPILAYWLGRAELGAGDALSAERALQTAVSLKPGSAPAHYWLGRTQDELQRYVDAVLEYEAALRLDSQTREYRTALERGQAHAAQRPFDDTRLGLTIEGGWQVDREQIEVKTRHLYDYTFNTAPTDWVQETGDWKIRNRWTCFPDWNWLGGESQLAAILWNKREFAGDQTLELYVSFKMNVLGMGGYRNGTDLNVTICGDGRNLSSGYSFIIGGWANTVTRLLRRNQIVAETRDPQFHPVSFRDYSPPTWEWQRRWWQIRARKVGKVISLYLDNKLALQYYDPQPLPGGRMAIWTFDNGIIIPRCRIYYEQEKLPRTPVQYAVPPAESPAGAGEPRLQLSSTTHPALFNDFEQDLGQWASRDNEHGAQLLLSDDTPSGKGHSLKLINRNTGGTFGATAVKTQFDAVQLPWLEFDYKISPSLKLNLFVTAGGIAREIIFSAPEFPSDRFERLGTIPGVVADGKWHHARFDLLGHLRRLFASQDSIPVTELYFAVDTNKDYIQAGFNGNPALCTWYVDNFWIHGAAGKTVQVVVAAGAEKPAAIQIAADRSPDGSPPANALSPDASGKVQFANLKDGLHWLHARSKSASGTWGPVRHYPIVVDTSGPRLVEAEPAPGVRSGASRLTLKLDDAGAGVDGRSLVLKVNDKSLDGAAPCLDYDPDSQQVTVDLNRARVVASDGAPVQVSLVAANDRLGNALTEPKSWSFLLDYQLDKTPPPSPRLILARDYLFSDDFELGLDEWASREEPGWNALTRDSSTAASGRYSLKIHHQRSHGSFSIRIRRTPFDAGVYRYVSFDYKVGDGLRLDLGVLVNGDWRTVRFTDTDGTHRIGEVPGVVRDNQWHHAEFDLYKMLARDDPVASNYLVHELILHDWNNAGNVQHEECWFDNFRIAPVISTREGLPLRLATADLSGIRGVNYDLSKQPDQPLAAQVRTADLELRLPHVVGSLMWLSARAVDGAGNWSDISRFPFVADDGQPTASAGTPAEGGDTAVSEVVLPLADVGDAGIDPQSIKIEIGGRLYDTNNAGLRYESNTRRLVYNCEKVSPEPVVFGDGQIVNVALKSAADYAGNPVSSLPAWSWRMNYAKDRTPPSVARLESSTHRSWRWNSFEEALGECGPVDSNSPKLELDAANAASGQRSLKATAPAAGGNLSFFLLHTPYDTSQFPYLAFDYKMPPEAKVDVVLYFGEHQEELYIQFSDNAGGYRGVVKGLQLDNHWHHAQIDIGSVVAQRQREFGWGGTIINWVMFRHRGYQPVPGGLSFSLDNLIVGAPGGNSAQLNWFTTDTTGIVNYAWALDDHPLTQPSPEQPKGTGREASFPDLAPGVHFFHLRAKDGAGNWGPTRHYAILTKQ